MEIRLTRNQLLETLREMGVHYPADADEETLKQLNEIFDTNKGRPIRTSKPAPEAYAW